MSTSAVRREAGGFPSIAAFESCDFNVEAFNHESHIYVAWKMLESYPVLETVTRAIVDAYGTSGLVCLLRAPAITIRIQLINTCQAMHNIPSHATANESVRSQGMANVKHRAWTMRAQK
jgi:hypothetical protein